jgi:hypothetical protein
MDHNCQFIVDWHTEPGEDGDPIFCDKFASIKWDGVWFCAEHYDEAAPEKPVSVMQMIRQARNRY